MPATMNAVLPTRFGVEQLKLLDQARDALGLSRSSFVRMATVVCARATLTPGEPASYAPEPSNEAAT